MTNDTAPSDDPTLAYTYEIPPGDPIATTELGYTVFSGSPEAITTYLQRPIDWKHEGHHPLTAALLNGRDAIAIQLIQAGATITAQHFYLAYRFGTTKTFTVLTTQHLDLLTDPDRAATIFIEAARNGDLASMQLVQPKVTNLNKTDYFYGFPGWTAFHHAVGNGHIPMITWLIAQGADPLCLTTDNDNAVDIFLKSGYKFSRSERQQLISLLLAQHIPFPSDLSFFTRFLIKQGFAI